MLQSALSHFNYHHTRFSHLSCKRVRLSSGPMKTPAKKVHEIVHEPIATPSLPLNNFRENHTYQDDDLDDVRALPENIDAEELAQEFYP